MIKDAHLYTRVRSELICDNCEKVISEHTSGNLTENHQTLSELGYQDMNFGHECSSCKRSRERDYDAYVCSLGAYH